MQGPKGAIQKKLRLFTKCLLVTAVTLSLVIAAVVYYIRDGTTAYLVLFSFLAGLLWWKTLYRVFCDLGDAPSRSASKLASKQNHPPHDDVKPDAGLAIRVERGLVMMGASRREARAWATRVATLGKTWEQAMIEAQDGLREEEEGRRR